MLSILLAEDHILIRHAIKMLLEADEQIEVTAQAGSAIEAMDILNHSPMPDVLLIEVAMPHGIELIAEALETSSNLKVIALSISEDIHLVRQAFARGASGYLLKECTVDELRFALKHIVEGGQYICTGLSARLLERTATHSTSLRSDHTEVELSDREMEVIQLIAEGLTTTEMSEKLFLSRRTVEGHRQSLLEKTRSKNTAQLVRYASLKELIF